MDMADCESEVVNWKKELVSTVINFFRSKDDGPGVLERLGLGLTGGQWRQEKSYL